MRRAAPLSFVLASVICNSMHARSSSDQLLPTVPSLPGDSVSIVVPVETSCIRRASNIESVDLCRREIEEYKLRHHRARDRLNAYCKQLEALDEKVRGNPQKYGLKGLDASYTRWAARVKSTRLQNCDSKSQNRRRLEAGIRSYQAAISELRRFRDRLQRIIDEMQNSGVPQIGS